MSMLARKTPALSPPSEWLSLAAQEAFNEMYLVDGRSLRILDTNESARQNLQYDSETLIAMTLPQIVSAPSGDMLQQALMQSNEKRSANAQLSGQHRRRDGSSYPVELRVIPYSTSPDPVYIVVANDVSGSYACTQALHSSEARFQAIARNTPGLVFQCLWEGDGEMSFPYLSERCEEVLGIPAATLSADSNAFWNILLLEDRTSCRKAMETSAARMTTWNWEGRIWIEKWQDVKWINLRATPRAVPAGVLWEGIMTNITQGKLEQAELNRSRMQLAEFSAHVETAKEKERARIAREIHDDLGGNLTAIKMALALFKHRLIQAGVDLIEQAGYIDTLVDRTIDATQRIAADLRPGVLDFGIVAAAEWQAKEFEKQHGVPCRFISNRKEIALSPEHAIAVFRILQEALTNIGKHAKATQVTVKMTAISRSITMQVMDNGCGIAASDRQKRASFGIRGMIERAKALGGELSIQAPANGGSTVTLRIPLNAAFLLEKAET